MLHQLQTEVAGFLNQLLNQFQKCVLLSLCVEEDEGAAKGEDEDGGRCAFRHRLNKHTHTVSNQNPSGSIYDIVEPPVSYCRYIQRQ